MGRKLLIISVLLSFIFLNVSDTFGDNRCLHDGVDYTDDPLQEYHTCKKVRDYFCYFPKSDNTIAPHLKKGEPKDISLSDEKIPSIYGGCRLSIDYPQNRIWANFEDNVINFVDFCRWGNYFSTKMDITYKAYDKGNPVDNTEETDTSETIPIGGYELDGKINAFKTKVNDVNDDTYDRDVYTLRVKKAIITDNKCPPPKSKIEDKPISVATKLLLELKLNADDRIVYDDKETKKIEVNADQDEFYFGGTLIS